MQHCAGFISAESLYMFRASSGHHYSDSAEIKPAQFCIKLVFHLTYTMMNGSTKLKSSGVTYLFATFTATIIKVRTSHERDDSYPDLELNFPHSQYVRQHSVSARP